MTEPGLGKPGNGIPMASRTKLRTPSQATAYAAGTTLPSATVTRTPASSCSIPVTWEDQRISAPSSAARAASSCSIWLCGMSSR